MQIFLILPLISAIFVLVLGTFVLLASRREKLNILFILLCLCLSIWFFGTFMMFRSETDKWAIFWDRIIYVGVVFIPAIVYHFSVIFSKAKKQGSIVKLGYILSSLFFVLSRTDYFVSGLHRYSWGCHAKAQSLHHIFLVIFISFIALVFWNLYRHYRKVTTRVDRIQTIYVFIAFGIMAGIGSLAFSAAYGIGYFPFAYLSGIVFAPILAYAVLKHHLLNIRIIAAEILVGAILLTLLIQTTLSRSTGELVGRIVFLVLVGIFGYFLIRGILLEIKRREQIQALAKRLAEANKHLKTLMKMKSEFLTVASHQLRTPTGIVYGMLSMLDEGELTPQETKDFIHKAFLGSKRLQELVGDLLRATELEAGKMELTFREQDMEELVKEAMEYLRPKAEEKGLEFSYQILTKPLSKVKIDSTLMKEAITVLIDNAIIYTPKGYVKVILDTKDKNFIVSVKDSGIGITKEDRKRLFIKFSRGEEALKVVPNGTGLGLYIAKMVTDLHKGKIEVESEGKNKGSTFSIILPMK